MKTIWIICETVDLGYRMIKGYTSYNKAKAELDRMNSEAILEKRNALMKHCNYTKEQADDWCSGCTFYELHSTEIKE